MTDLERKMKQLNGTDLASLRYRAQEGVASDDELVLFRMYYTGLSEVEARKDLDTYRLSFLPDCVGLH